MVEDKRTKTCSWSSKSWSKTLCDFSLVAQNDNKSSFDIYFSASKPIIIALCVLSPDVAASRLIADMLLNAEESWPQRLADPTAPLPCANDRYDCSSHDISTPVKNLWVYSFICVIRVPPSTVSSSTPSPLTTCLLETHWASLSLKGTVCWRSVPCSERQA